MAYMEWSNVVAIDDSNTVRPVGSSTVCPKSKSLMYAAMHCECGQTHRGGAALTANILLEWHAGRNMAGSTYLMNDRVTAVWQSTSCPVT